MSPCWDDFCSFVEHRWWVCCRYHHFLTQAFPKIAVVQRQLHLGKKQGGDFDVTMDSFDGAEVCELVGLYLLSLLCEHFNKDQIDSCRDDGLAALQLSRPQADRARKDLCEIFRSCGLKVTVDILMTQTDFLDVTFDLSSGKYWPYRKPNDEPLYIHAKSSHPPSVYIMQYRTVRPS